MFWKCVRNVRVNLFAINISNAHSNHPTMLTKIVSTELHFEMAKNFAKMSENIAYKSSSLHNLLPAIPKLNVSTQPANLTFSFIKYGKCIMLLLKILFKNSCFECLLFSLFFVCWQWLELFLRLARLCTLNRLYN